MKAPRSRIDDIAKKLAKNVANIHRVLEGLVKIPPIFTDSTPPEEARDTLNSKEIRDALGGRHDEFMAEYRVISKAMDAIEKAMDADEQRPPENDHRPD